MADFTLTEAQGLAKKVYDDSVHDLRTEQSVIVSKLPFSDASRVGDAYQVSMALRLPNGFTYAGSEGTSATALKAGRPMVLKQASIKPFEMDLREPVLWVALSRLAKEGKAAVADSFGELMQGMKMSSMNRLEASALLGQRSLGTVESVTDLGGGAADLKITEPTWRPGLWWAVGEGTTLDAFTSTTKNNGSGPLVISGIKSRERKITVTYTGTLANEVAADDVLYFEGAWDGTTYSEMPGLIAQGAVTSGTSPIGLDTSTYSNAKGNTYDVAGNMDFDVLEDVCADLRDRGASGVLKAYFPNRTVSKLLSQLRQLRIIDSSYSPQKAKVGTKGVEFETMDLGPVELIPHPFMAWGEGLVQSEARLQRSGSSDISFTVPGLNNGQELIHVVNGYNRLELINFSDQFVINKRPNHACHLTGITHT